MPKQNQIKFTVKLLSIQGTPHFKFGRNSFNSWQGTSEQNFVNFFSFLSSFSSCTLQNPIWQTRIGGLKVNLINIQEVINVLCVKKVKLLSHLQADAVGGTS